ncbi:MAG: hypothetical protein R3E31_00225 [Chloroflexota bacterium]
MPHTAGQYSVARAAADVYVLQGIGVGLLASCLLGWARWAIALRNRVPGLMVALIWWRLALKLVRPLNTP